MGRSHDRAVEEEIRANAPVLKAFNRDQAKNYLKDPHLCPCCGSGEIEGSSIEVDHGACWQEITCLHCYAAWFDNYTLTGISPHFGPECPECGNPQGYAYEPAMTQLCECKEETTPCPS